MIDELGPGQLNVLDEVDARHDADTARALTREWISTAAFAETADYFKVIVSFDTPAERVEFLRLAGREDTPPTTDAVDQDGLFDVAEWTETAAPTGAAAEADAEWRGLPYFYEPPKPAEDETFQFETQQERDSFLRSVNIRTVRVSWHEGRSQAVRWPDRPYDDLASLRFCSTAGRVPRFPVYIPSVGRHENPYTIRFLEADGVDHHVVVRAEEEQAYRRVCGSRATLHVLPSDVTNLLETRLWIRDHAERSGAAGHWQFDDNIDNVFRLYRGKRIPVDSGPAIAAVEDFALRYDNVGVAGMNYDMFTLPGAPPYRLNCHVYSATLMLHRCPCRWRLVYNDDTDLCLQALSSGWATLLTNVFNVKKRRTMTMSGGNTDALYQGDGRMEMARALEREWPGVVTVVKKYGRPTHQINWIAFRTRVPLRSAGLKPAGIDEYGLELRQVRTLRSPYLRHLVAQYQEDVGLDPLLTLNRRAG